MVQFKQIPLLAMFMLTSVPGRAFSELYLKPGDSGVFDFTVINATDSVDALPEWGQVLNLDILG